MYLTTFKEMTDSAISAIQSLYTLAEQVQW